MEQYNHLQQKLEKKSKKRQEQKRNKHGYSIFRLRELIMKKARQILKRKTKNK